MDEVFDPAKFVAATAAPAEKEAEDWIAKAARESNEALAKRAAGKNASPPPNQGALINVLARTAPTEYDLVRAEAAEALGLRKGTLDNMVAEQRKALGDKNADEPAHWRVSPALEMIDGADLLNRMRAVFRRYIVLPPGADIALPLWVMHAWTHEAFEISPIACLTSPTKRCGKTNVLILLEFLTPRSELSANVTSASVFRYIEELQPTLLIDEADSFLGDNDQLRGILNSGHTRAGARVSGWLRRAVSIRSSRSRPGRQRPSRSSSSCPTPWPTARSSSA